MTSSAPISVVLPEDLRLQLARMAAERRMSEADLVQRAVRRLLDADRAPGLPLYARRLGPIA